MDYFCAFFSLVEGCAESSEAGSLDFVVIAEGSLEDFFSSYINAYKTNCPVHILYQSSA